MVDHLEAIPKARNFVPWQERMSVHDPADRPIDEKRFNREFPRNPNGRVLPARARSVNTLRSFVIGQIQN
jgi:hypothetical protein